MPRMTNEDMMILEGVAPIDANDGALAANYISLKNTSHVTIVIKTGAGWGSPSAVTLHQSTAVGATSEKSLAFSNMYTNDGATGAADLTKTAVTSNTFNLDTALAMYVIEIDADLLDVDNNFDCMTCKLADPGAAGLVDITYILSGNRFSGDTTPLSD